MKPSHRQTTLFAILAVIGLTLVPESLRLDGLKGGLRRQRFLSSSDGKEKIPIVVSKEQMPLSVLDYVKRGNFFTDQSACDLCKWQTSNGHVWEDIWLCGEESRDQKYILTETNVKSELKRYDTIFVLHTDVDDFTAKILPLIETDVIILTEIPPHEDARMLDSNWHGIIESPHVKHMFTQNPWLVHDKVDGIPQGIGRAMERSVSDFQQRMLQSLEVKNRTHKIFVSAISKYTNPKREWVPSGPYMRADTYYESMMNCQYVLSPDGDRPDCKRHWEAIGLGTKPVTMLNRTLYGPLFGDSVVYDYPLPWKLLEMGATLEDSPTDVDRRLVFEEYWVEVIEQTVGVGPLGWKKDLSLSTAERKEVLDAAEE